MMIWLEILVPFAFLLLTFERCFSATPDQCQVTHIRDQRGVVKSPRTEEGCNRRRYCMWHFDYPAGSGAVKLTFTRLTPPSEKSRLYIANQAGRTIELIHLLFRSKKNTCTVLAKSDFCARKVASSIGCTNHPDLPEPPYFRYRCDPSELQFDVMYEFVNCQEETTTSFQDATTGTKHILIPKIMNSTKNINSTKQSLFTAYPQNTFMSGTTTSYTNFRTSPQYFFILEAATSLHTLITETTTSPGDYMTSIQDTLFTFPETVGEETTHDSEDITNTPFKVKSVRMKPSPTQVYDITTTPRVRPITGKSVYDITKSNQSVTDVGYKGQSTPKGHNQEPTSRAVHPKSSSLVLVASLMVTWSVWWFKRAQQMDIFD